MSKILKFGDNEDDADNKKHRDNRRLVHQELLSRNLWKLVEIRELDDLDH